MAKQKKSAKRSNTGFIIIAVVVVVVVIALILTLVLTVGRQGATTRQVEALVNVNLREGPGADYAVVDNVAAGEEVTAVGRNQDSSWLQVETGSGQAWMTGDAEFVKINGDVSALPVVEAAEPAYDASHPLVNQMLNEIPLVIHHQNTQTCASHGGLNHLLPEVAEGNVIGPHAGDFIFKGDNVLFKYTNGSLVLIYENPVARFEGGAESLPFAAAMQLAAKGDIVWSGHIGDAGRQVPGCDPAAP